MHILYIHQYFATPRGSTGTRSYEFARRWVQVGHRVTLLTTVAQLNPADFGGRPQGRFLTRLNIDGIDVLALNVRYRQAMGYTRRVLSFLAFMVLSSWYAVRIPKVDVVFATSTPLTVGVPALVGRWFAGRRYVFEVRDPWPEVPIDMGLIRNPILKYLLGKFQRAVYRNAEAIVALSPGMRQLVQAAAPAGKRVVNIPNACDTDFFRPEIDGSYVRRKYGWDGRFVCLHTGAMGRANALDLIIRAARHFMADNDFLFVLVGEGREKDVLRTQQRDLGLTNLQILDSVAKHELPAMLAAADLCVVCMAPFPILEHNSANKFFDYLSAGRPILVNYSGWQRETLEAARAGYGCRQGDDADFFAKLEAIRSDPARCLEMPRNARKLAMEQFNRDLLAGRTLEVILDAARSSSTG